MRRKVCWCFPHPYAIHSSSAGRVSTTEMANTTKSASLLLMTIWRWPHKQALIQCMNHQASVCLFMGARLKDIQFRSICWRQDTFTICFVDLLAIWDHQWNHLKVINVIISSWSVLLCIRLSTLSLLSTFSYFPVQHLSVLQHVKNIVTNVINIPVPCLQEIWKAHPCCRRLSETLSSQREFVLMQALFCIVQSLSSPVQISSMCPLDRHPILGQLRSLYQVVEGYTRQTQYWSTPQMYTLFWAVTSGPGCSKGG